MPIVVRVHFELLDFSAGWQNEVAKASVIGDQRRAGDAPRDFWSHGSPTSGHAARAVLANDLSMALQASFANARRLAQRCC
jgi:hypothetical protein